MKLRLALIRIVRTIETTHGVHALATPLMSKLHDVVPEEEFSISTAVEAFRITPQVKPIRVHPDLDAFLDAIGEEIAATGKRMAVSVNRPQTTYVVAAYLIYVTFVIKYLDLMLKAGHSSARHAHIDLADLKALFPGFDISDN